jgi:hypothetical protein
LPRLSRIYARGAESLENAKKLGLPNVELAADVGFFEAKPNSGQEFVFIKNIRKPIVGVSVSSVVYEKCQNMGIDYIKCISEFIRYLVDNLQCSVIIIPHAVRKGESMRNNDTPVIKRILKISQGEHVHYFNTVERAYDLRRLIFQPATSSWPLDSMAW